MSVGLFDSWAMTHKLLSREGRIDFINCEKSIGRTVYWTLKVRSRNRIVIWKDFLRLLRILILTCFEGWLDNRIPWLTLLIIHIIATKPIKALGVIYLIRIVVCFIKTKVGRYSFMNTVKSGPLCLYISIMQIGIWW